MKQLDPYCAFFLPCAFTEHLLCWALEIQRWNTSRPVSLIVGILCEPLLCPKLCVTSWQSWRRLGRSVESGVGHTEDISWDLWLSQDGAKGLRDLKSGRPLCWWGAVCGYLCLIILDRQQGRGGHPIPSQKSSPLFSWVIRWAVIWEQKMISEGCLWSWASFPHAVLCSQGPKLASQDCSFDPFPSTLFLRSSHSLCSQLWRVVKIVHSARLLLIYCLSSKCPFNMYSMISDRIPLNICPFKWTWF